MKKTLNIIFLCGKVIFLDDACIKKLKVSGLTSKSVQTYPLKLFLSAAPQ